MNRRLLDQPEPGAERPGRVPRALMQRLLDNLRQRQQRRQQPLQPPGARSGEGAKSLEPYLEQGRNTRPSPLE